jgi:hypothetical protein
LGARAFSPGHSSDYWTLALLVSGFGSIGTAINIIATILCLRCPGMKLSRMPLLVWMNLVMAGMVLLAITPLSAAQIMLLIDRYLGGHFFDTQAGGSAVLWMHFFWIFGHPEVYVLIIPCFAFMSEIIPVFSRKPIFGYRVREHERLGAPHVHDRNEFLCQQLFHPDHDGRRNSHRNQDFQLDRYHMGWKDSVQDADAVQHRVSIPISHRGPDRHHDGRFAIRLAA